MCLHQMCISSYTMLMCYIFLSIKKCCCFFCCNSCVWISQLSLMWKDSSSNHTITAGKKTNMQGILEKQRLCRTRRIFQKNSGQINRTGTCKQLSQSIKTIMDHPGHNRQLRFMGICIFEQCSFFFHTFSYYFVLWSYM